MSRKPNLDSLDAARMVQFMLDELGRGKSIDEVMELCQKQMNSKEGEDEHR